MKLFKTLRRKVGNAIIPVVGTILGLTILAGSVVGVAVNSSKIVYRQNNLENQNDARQILYLACKYFCKEINDETNPKTATKIREELQEIFGPGLKITKDKTKEDTYYIWYPNRYKTGNEYTSDDNVAEWLKATVTKKETEDEDGDHGASGPSKTIFQQDAKIDEKYSIGNLMTSYLADKQKDRPEKLLPGRAYDINQISLVESDIDTFDEAFTYMNNTGVLQIDDIAVALYKFAVLDEGEVDYISTPSEIFDPQHSEKTEKPYTIVYKTGNLGGNYYWLDGSKNQETWLYRQEYDLKLLADMINYFENSSNANEDNLTYSYDETKDEHVITCSALSLGNKYKFSSSQKFADKIAEYIFWKNIPYLAVHLSTVRSKMYESINNSLTNSYFTVNGNYGTYDLVDDYNTFYNHYKKNEYYSHTEEVPTGWFSSETVYYYYCWIEQNYFEWDNDGLKINVNFRDFRLPGPDGLRWYRQQAYTINSIKTFCQNQKITQVCDTSGGGWFSSPKYTFNAQKLYNALIDELSATAIEEYKTTVYEKKAQAYYLDPNNQNHLNDDVQNKSWNDGGAFSNHPKTTTQTYYLQDLEVKRYERYERGSGKKKYYEYVSNPSGSYLRNNALAAKDDEKKHQYVSYKTYSEWVTYYSDQTRNYAADGDYNYFIDANGYLNPNFYTANNSKESVPYTVSTGNDKLTIQIIEYLTGIFKQKTSSTAALTQLLTAGAASSSVSADDKKKMTFEGFAADGDQLIYGPQVFYESDKQRFRLQYRYTVVVKFVSDTYNGTEKYVSKFRYKPDDWLDSVYLSRDEFFELFKEGLAQEYVNHRMTDSEKEVIQQIITKTDVSKQYLKQLLVEPMRYQYFPNSDMASIVGDNAQNGMREDQITNKLITYYVEKNKSVFSSVGTEVEGSDKFNYKIDIISNEYAPYSGTGDYLNYIIKFTVSVDTNGDGDYTDSTDVKITKRVSFLLQYMTYSPLNNARLSTSSYTYTDVKNNNFKEVKDPDTGQTENIFWLVNIKDSDNQNLDYLSITTKTIPTILTAIPYTKREGSEEVSYKDHRITVDAEGADYVEISGIDKLSSETISVLSGYDISGNPVYKNVSCKVVDKNYIIKKSVTISSGNIYIKPSCSLFIDGKLTLKDDVDVYLGKKAMLFVNDNLSVDYEYMQEMEFTTSFSGKTWRARQLTAGNISYFQSHGVDIYSNPDAKIIVNGNFDYKGIKAKKAESDTFNISIANDPSGLLLDRVYEQYVFNTGFKTGFDCDQDDDGHWKHYGSECRGALQGIYIVNGDVIFHASNDKLTTNGTAAKYQWYAMYSNAYSNPIINGTFYIDGTFDMTGLYTSGLYDKCRANFIFSKSITQPYVQLNTILCAEDPTYGGWKESDGFLFIICEEAIDFSKDSFGSVNLFTPFQELVNAINNHKTSETNFAEYIEFGEFKKQFPDDTVIRDWGLPPLLMSGFSQMYQPGDIGNIKAENEFNSAGDTVI